MAVTDIVNRERQLNDNYRALRHASSPLKDGMAAVLDVIGASDDIASNAQNDDGDFIVSPDEINALELAIDDVVRWLNYLYHT